MTVIEKTKPQPEPTTTITSLFGGCRTATMIDQGTCGSSRSALDWHQACRGAATDARGRLNLCSCGCHADPDRPLACVGCGQTDTELTDDRRCIDTEGCHEHQHSSERLARFRHYQEVGRAARAERAAAEGNTDPDRPARAPRGERVVKVPQACHHGCGEMTKGGLFIAGHDAKLKSLLMKAGAAGDIDAVVEMKLRGWFPTAGKGRDRYTDDVVEAADAKIQDTTTDAFLAQRVTARSEAQ